MSDLLKTEMVLAGAYAGRNVRINGHEFINGVCVLHGQPETLEGAVKYLATYQAYPKGSEELATAQARDAGVAKTDEVQADGDNRDTEANTESGSTEEVQGDSSPSGESAEADADDGSADAEAKEGDAGSSSDGDGHADAGVSDESEETSGKGGAPDSDQSINEALRKVVMNLDPKNDDHWTDDGMPKLATIEEAYGSADVTRADVDAVEPGWDRDKASELQELNG